MRMYNIRVKVECYISMGCVSEPELKKNLSDALREMAPDAEVVFLRVSAEEAEKLGLRGSPSVLIDGRDIQPAGMEGFG